MYKLRSSEKNEKFRVFKNLYRAFYTDYLYSNRSLPPSEIYKRSYENAYSILLDKLKLLENQERMITC